MAKNIEINIKTNDGYETLYPENQCLKLSGGTMTGNLTVNGNTVLNGSVSLNGSIVNSNDATTKEYVDGRYTAGNGIVINDGVIGVDLTNLNETIGTQGWTNCGNFVVKYGSRSTSFEITVPLFDVYKFHKDINVKYDKKWNRDQITFKPEVVVENHGAFGVYYNDDGSIDEILNPNFVIRSADIGVSGTSSEGDFDWESQGTFVFKSKTDTTVTFTYTDNSGDSYWYYTNYFTIYGRNVSYYHP